MPREDTFLFDLDGTLIDSVELILRSYRYTLQTHRGEVPDDAEWIAGMGTPLRKQLRRFARTWEELEAMVATYSRFNMDHHDDLVRPFAGIRDALLALKARGCRLGVVTSKMRRGALRGLRVCGLEDLVDNVVAADDVGNPKPHPEPVLMAIERLSAHPSRTVFVGDSPHDMASGRAAGIRVAAVLWGPFSPNDLEAHAPDFWLHEPRDVVKVKLAS